MTRTLWRIGVDAPAYQADDLTGRGAEITGGRWNPTGMAMIYTSETRALACLETLVHLNAGGLPLNRYLVEISVAESVWAKAQQETDASLQVGWDAAPQGQTSMAFGMDWIRGGRTALLIVPSAIVPEESNVLINPQHADSKAITARKMRRWAYDPRLKSASA